MTCRCFVGTKDQPIDLTMDDTPSVAASSMLTAADGVNVKKEDKTEDVKIVKDEIVVAHTGQCIDGEVVKDEIVVAHAGQYLDSEMDFDWDLIEANRVATDWVPSLQKVVNTGYDNDPMKLDAAANDNGVAKDNGQSSTSGDGNQVNDNGDGGQGGAGAGAGGSVEVDAAVDAAAVAFAAAIAAVEAAAAAAAADGGRLANDGDPEPSDSDSSSSDDENDDDWRAPSHSDQSEDDSPPPDSLADMDGEELAELERQHAEGAAQRAAEYAAIAQMFLETGFDHTVFGSHWGTIRGMVDTLRCAVSDVENLAWICQKSAKVGVPVDVLRFSELIAMVDLPARHWARKVKKALTRIRNRLSERVLVTGYGAYASNIVPHPVVVNTDPAPYAGPSRLDVADGHRQRANDRADNPPAVLTTDQLMRYDLQTVERPFLGPKGMQLREDPPEGADETQLAMPGGDHSTVPTWIFRMTASERYSMHPAAHVFMRELAVQQSRKGAYPAYVHVSVINGLRRSDWRYSPSLQRAIENLRVAAKQVQRKASIRDVEVALGFCFFQPVGKCEVVRRHLTDIGCQEVMEYGYVYDVRDGKVWSRSDPAKELDKLTITDNMGYASAPIRVSQQKLAALKQQKLWSRVGTTPGGVPIFECQTTRFFGVRAELERLASQQFDVRAEIDAQAAAATAVAANPPVLTMAHDGPDGEDLM